MIVKINEDTTEQIEKNLKILSNSVDNIKNLVHISYCSLLDKERKERLKNPYMVKNILKHLAMGMNEENAILLTAEKFDTTYERVSAVYSGQKKYKSAILLFAKKYLCMKLKQSGFLTREIAAILNVSENHIYKLLNCGIDYWTPKTKIILKRKK